MHSRAYGLPRTSISTVNNMVTLITVTLRNFWVALGIGNYKVATIAIQS